MPGLPQPFPGDRALVFWLPSPLFFFSPFRSRSPARVFTEPTRLPDDQFADSNAVQNAVGELLEHAFSVRCLGLHCMLVRDVQQPAESPILRTLALAPRLQHLCLSDRLGLGATWCSRILDACQHSPALEQLTLTCCVLLSFPKSPAREEHDKQTHEKSRAQENKTHNVLKHKRI